jgi:hypothetical protein
MLPRTKKQKVNLLENQALINAVNAKQFAKVQSLLRSGLASPIEEIVIAAATAGDLEILKLLERWSGKVNAQHNAPLIEACKKGHLEIVDFLLEHPAVDPADQNNQAIQSAVEANHIGIVKRLLRDQRVSPHDAMLLACKKGHEEMVNLLMADDRFNPSHVSINKKNALQIAHEFKHTGIIALLLRDSRVINITPTLTIEGVGRWMTATHVSPIDIVKDKFEKDEFVKNYDKFKLFKQAQQKERGALPQEIVFYIGLMLFKEIKLLACFLLYQPLLRELIQETTPQLRKLSPRGMSGVAE